MKILMRANMYPENAFSPLEVISKDKVGTNIGNMLFPYSITRWLYKDNEKIEIESCIDWHNKTAKEINDNYDMLLLPFANAFRSDFISTINHWTALIKQLTIPCIVIGIGLQAKIDSGFELPFNKDVYDFCSAVLEKSNSIGVRGEITRKYLIHIGIPADKVVTIGCPSMYMNGNDPIPVTKKDFSEIQKISFNSTQFSPTIPLINQWMKQYSNSCFVAQETWVLVLLYSGYQDRSIFNNYICDYNHPVFKEGRLVSFTDTLSWLHFLYSNIGLSVGARIHGNIASTIAGVPTLIIATDTRVQELADFFDIPCRSYKDIDITNESLEKWYNETDFEKINKRYPEALAIYCRFLDDNQVPYKIPEKRIDFDNLKEEGLITSSQALSYEEREKQLCDCISGMLEKRQAKIDFLNQKCSKIWAQYLAETQRRSELNQLHNKKVAELEKQLKKKEGEIHKLKSSKSYRIGHMLVYIPGKILRFFKRI